MSAAPPSSEPGRWQVGDVRITRVDERCDPYPVGAMLDGVTPDDLAPHRAWLAPHFVNERGDLLVSVHALVIESDGLRIIVDTCLGESVPEDAGVAPEPRFLERMEAAGFPRASVDRVLCTHLHFDHVGWNTIREGGRLVPTFPRARYLFAEREWAHWNAAREKGYASTLEERVRPLIEAGLVDLVPMDHRLTSSVRLQPTPGHTPGHVSVVIESGGERAFITGDMVFHPVQWAETAWANGADGDREAARRMREETREALAAEDSLVIGTHFAPPTAGHVRRATAGWRFEADE